MSLQDFSKMTYKTGIGGKFPAFALEHVLHFSFLVSVLVLVSDSEFSSAASSGFGRKKQARKQMA